MKLTALLGISVLSLCAHGGQGDEKPLPLTFGVYPTDKATVMYRCFTPLLDKLEEGVTKHLGKPVDIQLTIFKSYEDGINALCDGTVDFVHFGPASYIESKKKNPNIELVGMEHEKGKKTFDGVIFVVQRSPIRSLGDLKGKRFAFGDPNSTIGRFLVQAELVKAGVFLDDLAGFRYLERHDQVAAAVEHGDFDAGAVKSSSFEKANEKNTLRKIWTFQNVMKPVVARAKMDRDIFDAFQKGLFELTDPALFKDLGKISGFTTATDAEYDSVREGMKKAEEFAKKHDG